MNKTKNILNMNDEITFHKYSEPEDEIQIVKNILPEFDNEDILDALKRHNYQVEAVIEDLLSERFIKQNLSENDIKRNSKILEIYNNEANKLTQEIVLNKGNTVIVNDITNSKINITEKNEKINNNNDNDNNKTNNSVKNEKSSNKKEQIVNTTTSNNNNIAEKDVNNNSTDSIIKKKKKNYVVNTAFTMTENNYTNNKNKYRNRNRNSNKSNINTNTNTNINTNTNTNTNTITNTNIDTNIDTNTNTNDNTYTNTNSYTNKNTNSDINANSSLTINTNVKKKRNRNRNKRKSTQSPKETSPSSTTSQDSISELNNTTPIVQKYFKLSEVKNMFPNISDRLLILTLQVNNGDIDKVVDFLLMHDNIKNDINEEDICRSLELQLENEQGLNTHPCDGNCINQGYPCYIHSRLFITKEDEFNTLNLSEIMKVWNKYELRDQNIDLSFTNSDQAIKYYTSDNEEIEFLIINRIKEAELAMTLEEKQHQDDVEYFRNREEQLKLQKYKFFNEANKKYRSGGLTGFSSAAYYSDEGRQLINEIEKAKLLAVSAQIRKNEKRYMQANGLTRFCGVDLHGLTVKEAISYLADMLNIWKMEIMRYYPNMKKVQNPKPISSVICTTTETYDFTSENSKCKSFSKVVSSKPKPQEETLNNIKITKVETLKKKKTRCLYPRVFNIITGRGIHSDANIGARLKPNIINYLKNHKFNFVEVNSGSIEVRL
ncbi:hypothetical protein BCR32DRAFT_291902 [Anaeromyces robustus]|uniref:Smr domain-containing protein n=1 Tax=Anaeromyces robustus TaxID=1754192 RepID=A0A1Y1XCV9_9FUNG|nr:hypothetical protein BCR32DRAFT_291902 [Anaeromyces robustus]|eukprot:ORX83579.1 hypothetical protein BCR32DRAFT_291902 [Anaeromyces robustus]